MNNFDSLWYLKVLSIIHFLVLATTTTDIHGQNYIFDNYNSKDGFFSSQAFFVITDKKSNRWIGTESGLVKYNAHTFKYFRHKYNDSLSISADYVKLGALDKHDRLWINCANRLNLFDLNTNKVNRLLKWNKYFGNLTIKDIHYNEKQDIVYVVTDEGIYYNKGHNVDFKKLHIYGIDYKKNLISRFHVMDDGKYVLCGNFGVYVIDENKKNIKKYSLNDINPKEKIVFITLYIENNHTIWAGTWIHGLMKIDLKNDSKQHFYWEDYNKILNGTLAIIRSEIDSLIWLGTTSGVMTLDESTKKFYSYNTDNENTKTSTRGHGFCFTNDKEAGLWIGTHQGLYRLSPNKNIFKKIELKTKHNYGSSYPTHLQFEKHQNKKDSLIWYLTDYGNIYYYDIVNQKHLPLPKQMSKYHDQKTNPLIIKIQNDSILWISTELFGVATYNLKSKEYREYEHIKYLTKIYNILPVSNNNVLLLSHDNCFVATYKNNNTIFESCKDPYSFVNDTSMSIMRYRTRIDHVGNIWTLAFDKKNKIRVPVLIDLKQNKQLYFTLEQFPEFHQIITIEELKSINDSSVMVFGNNGAGIISIKSNTKYEYTPLIFPKNKFATNFSNFEIDKNGNYIFSNDFGIIIYKSSNNISFHLNSQNSNLPNHIQPKIYKSPNTNDIYLQNQKAIYLLKENTLAKKSLKQLVISEFKINDEPTDISPKNNDVIKLKYFQNDIEFELTNYSYFNSSENQYFYRIINHNNHLTQLTNNILKFNSLSYGKYSIEFTSSDCFGNESLEPILIHLHIIPPFWLRWYFLTFIFCLIIYFIYSIFRYREIQKLKLEKFRNKVARDLHDDMGSNLSYIMLLSELEFIKDNTNESFSKISEKSKEIMANMKEIVWRINTNNDKLEDVVKQINNFGEMLFERSSIQYSSYFESFQTKLEFDPESRKNYLLIFKEAMNNCVKYSNAKNAVFTVKIENNTLISSFEDDGIGFDSNLVFMGNGLKNMQTRSKQLNAKINITTSNNGTKIFLLLPIKKRLFKLF